MKNLKIVALAVLILILIPTLIYFISPKESEIRKNIVSPLPFLGNNILFGQEKSNYWKPKTDKVYSIGLKKPDISASSAISYDLTTDKLLFSKNINKRLPIASLTKIMTAIVAMESMELNKKINVSQDASSIGENSMGLSEGEELTLEELLYGLILPSGNDSAETIAQGSKVGRENFIYLMNKKAEDLGLSNSHFTNPSGLEGDGNQYSTPYDLLVITRYAITNFKEFVPITSTFQYHIPATSTHKAYYLENDTNLITSYPGVKGVKTGFTNEAGLCLVTYLEHGKHRIISVLLNSANRRQEMKDLLDYSLKTLGEKPPPHS